VRDAARSIAWTLAIGACALAFALFASGGLEQAEGPGAWLLLVAYAPYYGLVHARLHWPDTALVVAVVVAQFLWFFIGVVAVRRFVRRR
jgi:hypothetical protein